jgi:hypothetical protein
MAAETASKWSPEGTGKELNMKNVSAILVQDGGMRCTILYFFCLQISWK